MSSIVGLEYMYAQPVKYDRQIANAKAGHCLSLESDLERMIQGKVYSKFYTVCTAGL